MNIFKEIKPNKKIINLQGIVVFPVITGQRATILQDNQTISTSPVAAILEISKNGIVIETKNTIYQVESVYCDEFTSFINPNARISV